MRFNQKWEWTKNENGKNVRVQVSTEANRWNHETRTFKKQPTTYTTTFKQSEELVTYAGDFVVEIDAEAIAQRLVGTAAHSKSGKSTCMRGLVRARRLTQREIRRETKQYPFPANTTPIEEEAKP